MDKFKYANNAEMTAWDVSVSCVHMNEQRRRLKKKFRKIARKRLTNEVSHDIMNISNEKEVMKHEARW